ncbi:hypothetical protein RI129_004209 [Pyrocoelia pectoralis]|uniref:Jumonji domain-containing protein 4 n=1 Tax=Pyrocoelia pectoralis TaxID=417401 RepID=A0AAN7VBW1_9COLE
MTNEIEIDSSKFQLYNYEYSEPAIINLKISYNEFFEKYLSKNQACLIKNIAGDWNSSKLWIKEDSPNFSYLQQTYGDSVVSVTNCDRQSTYNQQPVKWKFRDYLDYWENRISNSNESTLYVKDWHLKNENPKDDFYDIPLYFASDWLNEYLIENSIDDYRFVYMGVNGTWSPFHVDVMTSYSWSTNVFGQKLWVLFPPGEEEHFYDSLGNLPNDTTDVKNKGKHFEIVQNPGDAMFVPSNWHHQVWNVTDTISINHNWINGCNLHNVWKAMEKNLMEVKIEINDCSDMENFLDHSQLMLKASFGFNFKEYFEFMLYIAMKRIHSLKKEEDIKLFEKYSLGRNHTEYDLRSIRYTLLDLINHCDTKELGCFQNLQCPPEYLLQLIDDIL